MNKKHLIWGGIITAVILVLLYFCYVNYYDIEYLLILQNFRNSIDNAWTPFMEWISHFAVNNLILVPIFIYWCISKESGLYTFASLYTALTINAAVKLTACQYRPWIRDARVYPAGDAITEATGYSFPSGHTMTAAPVYGSIGVSFKDKKWVPYVCVALILITAFSRNYLGVHTPQDVGVGLLISAWTLYLIHYLFKYLKKHPEKENKFLLIGSIASIVVLIYIFVKPYPLDYVDGKLLVDPKKMMVDSVADASSLLIFCASRYIEKTWVQFKETGFNTKGILINIVGLLLIVAFNATLKGPIIAALGDIFGKFCVKGFVVVYAVLIWPFILKLIFKNDTEETKTEETVTTEAE